MRSFIKSLTVLFALFGVLMAGVVVVTAVEDAAKQATVSRETTASIEEFLNIQPRTTWPALFGPRGRDMFDSVESSFLLSFEQTSHLTLDADQRRVVRAVIVPRLVELAARSVDKATALGLTSEEDIARVIIDDCMVNSPKYAKAMAKILKVDEMILAALAQRSI